MLTTSYPRSREDAAGRFVADAVEHLRAEGVEVEVVSPLSFRHFGIAYGHGVVGNLRRRPWLSLFVPAMLVSFARAARRATREADVVHAHWLPSGLAAAATGRPFVVQLWGPTSRSRSTLPGSRDGCSAAHGWSSAPRASWPMPPAGLARARSG